MLYVWNGYGIPKLALKIVDDSRKRFENIVLRMKTALSKITKTYLLHFVDTNMEISRHFLNQLPNQWKLEEIQPCVPKYHFFHSDWFYYHALVRHTRLKECFCCSLSILLLKVDNAL